MAFNSGSGSTVVTGNVNTAMSPIMPKTEQALVFEYTAGNGSWQTVYTVPANKILYVYCLFASSSANFNVAWNIDGAGGTEITDIFGAGNTSVILSTGIPLAKLIATETLQMTGTAGARTFFYGVVVDA